MSYISGLEIIEELDYLRSTTPEYRKAVADLLEKYPGMKRAFLDKWKESKFSGNY